MATKKIEDLDRNLCAIAMEIEELLTSGRIKAVAAIMVMDDGDVVFRTRYLAGGHFPLLAGTVILQRDLLDGARPYTKIPGDE